MLRKQQALHLGLILVSTLVVYLQVAQHHFVWDTIPFVLENPWLRDPDLADFWAMTTRAHHANWQPLVWYSHALDFFLFGEHPAGHHLMNVGLHLVNACLVYFLVLQLLSLPQPAAGWIACLTALGFALHPQHVESVAWVVERKDVLYSIFTLGCYLVYLHSRRERSRRAGVVAWLLFVLALMAKPMAVTVPAILILLDLAPLRRFELSARDLLRAVLEKMHYFLLSLAVALITLQTQAMAMPEALPLWVRALNALHNTWFYVACYLYPVNLSPFYPFPTMAEMLAPGFLLVGALFFVTATASALVAWVRGYRWPLVLLGFYLVTLLPVSGLVHVGPAKATDHYVYLATLPLSLLLPLFGYWILQQVPRARAAVFGLGITYFLALGALTNLQVEVWRNPLTLWTRVVQLYPEAAMAHRNLAAVYLSMGETDLALEHARLAASQGGEPARAYLDALLRELGAGQARQGSIQ
ncbi:MAG: hypothetical protein ACFHX7_17390 [Pseudomonadota bacterium]